MTSSAIEPMHFETDNGAAAHPMRAATAARWRRLLHSRDGDPGWWRPALLTLLVATAVLYLWDLSASGTANSFYAAAAQAGSTSWKAWFFGSLDKSNFITVDKPPASLWVMGLSGRIFGFNSWSLLAPQAIEGVAAVALLAMTIKRVAGSAAGLIGGAALALTPAAVLIFRFDNPDALLVLLLVAAAYCVTRALESASTRWLVGAGVAIGFGFLTKSGQALLIVPALGLAYLVTAPASLKRRLLQLLAALVALVVSCGWWLVTVMVWPASDRPYIGGSTNNNPLELAFGYNGFARLFGRSGGGAGGAGGGPGGGGTSFGGATGLGRMFRGEFGLEVSWLLPAALIGIVALVWLTRRAPRIDKTRAALIIWGGWLLTTAATFSFMKGTIHPYYTVALAPAIAAIVAIAATKLWNSRGILVRIALAMMVVASVVWGATLLHRNDNSQLTTIIAIGCGVLALAGLGYLTVRAPATRRVVTATALMSLLAVGVPVSAWGIDTAGTTHSGSIPTAVSSTGSSGGFGGTTGGGNTTSTALTTALQKTTTRWAAATVGSQTAATLELSSGTAVMAIGGFSGTDNAPTLAQFKAYVAAGDITYFVVGGGPGGGGVGGGGQLGGAPTGTGGAPGGSGFGSRPSGAPPAGARPSGSGRAPTGSSAMPGGTGAIGSRSGAMGGGGGSASAITAWVEAHYSKTTIGGQTVYELSK